MSEFMYGVVLWSDLSAGKAVFWCEDHGDLAFYEGDAETGQATLEFSPGDLVEFEVETEQRLRRARDPKLVGGQVFRDLPEVLRAREALASQEMPEPAPMVLPFAGKQKRAAGATR
ncbi:hypothetical protein ACFSUD_17055 [Sulfitobacter aestuarii]|uniref:Uncharacterized protein n=1 Tax=Sulfitobacter aestuarii TaxID=2161676 RepID=A0ABW5U615_9RHOB